MNSDHFNRTRVDLSHCYPEWMLRAGLSGLRVCEEINLHFQESRRPHGKARGGRIAGYLTDEQRSQAGWIGVLKCEVIFERALSFCRKKNRKFCSLAGNALHINKGAY